MPAWSPAIANAFIRMAAADGAVLDQMHLQELVYIAHGWCLAITGQPLTGDRPEAFNHGPEYPKLAQAFVKSGVDPVRTEIELADTPGNGPKTDAVYLDDGGLVRDERAIMAKVYAEYGHRATKQLAALTRAPGTPWEKVYDGGGGNGRDIAHHLIRDQFAKIADEFDA